MTTKRSIPPIIALICVTIFCNAMEQNNVPTVVNHDDGTCTVTYQKGDEYVTEKAIYRKNIFKYITGMEENEKFIEYVNKHKSIPLSEDLIALMKASENPNLMKEMVHTTSTVKDLRITAMEKLKSLPREHAGTFSIVNVDVVEHPEWRHLVDIGALQARYPNAVFQTASRANGLEGKQMLYKPNKNHFQLDKNGFQSILGGFSVQGEEAQIAAAIKGIYEIYLIEKNVNFFQNIGIVINNIGNVTNYTQRSYMNYDSIQVSTWKNIPVTTGYANVIYQNANIKTQKAFDFKAREDNIKDANILLDHSHLIHQVNVATFDLDPNRPTIKVLGETHGATLAQNALDMAYAAPLYYAINEEKNDVFLTLIGCGSFKNKLEWVAKSLEKIKKLIHASGLNIRLIALEANNSYHEGDNADAWKRIEEVARASGGTIERNGKLVVHPPTAQAAVVAAAEHTKKQPPTTATTKAQPAEPATPIVQADNKPTASPWSPATILSAAKNFVMQNFTRTTPAQAAKATPAPQAAKPSQQTPQQQKATPEKTLFSTVTSTITSIVSAGFKLVQDGFNWLATMWQSPPTEPPYNP